jgi:hypothetical protein
VLEEATKLLPPGTIPPQFFGIIKQALEMIVTEDANGLSPMGLITQLVMEAATGGDPMQSLIDMKILTITSA